MKITNISCTQFAGVRDRDVSFTDGINVIYGKNESGKSTLVHLLSRTLFQNAKLDRRSDKGFYDLYFPSAKKGRSITGDFIDGKITFETEKGIYTLSKEWGADPRCVLSTPDGAIRAPQDIEAVLKDALLYGEGVYSDMLFSSQRNTDLSLQTIMDASRKTDPKQALTDAISQAFAESDGISVDAIEQAIGAKIDELAGKHWDFDREAPARKAGRWSTGLGEVLKAYYALEDTKAVMDKISRLASDADDAASAHAKEDEAMNKAEGAYHRFNAFASRLAVRSERKKTIDRIEKELSKISQVLSTWPERSGYLRKATALHTEKMDRQILDRYTAAKTIVDEIKSLESKSIDLARPTDTEIDRVKAAQRDIRSLEDQLRGMNITAAIDRLGSADIQITSLRTGGPVDISHGIASITEAVKITIPGVLELRLTPADVDVPSIKAQIAQQEQIVADIFTKYQVGSLTALEGLAKTAAETKAKLDDAHLRLAMRLGSTTFDEAEAAANAVTSVVRPMEEILDDITALCGRNDLSQTITQTETVLSSYTADYGSIHDLEARASDLEAELDQARRSISDAADIPAAYLSIRDPEAHLEALRNDLKDHQRLREKTLAAKTAAASKLETYKEDIAADPAEEVEKAERYFEEQKALLRHWLHIQEVFQAQKDALRDHPMQDIAHRFTHYLGIISGGKVSSDFPEADKLKMEIYSDDKLLDHGKLSEGTKETVSLAFRLAVLDHLFPEGGGVIVLDDPFTDMDADRTARSCALIKECAKQHQVIFLTCKEDLLDMLSGNIIRF